MKASHHPAAKILNHSEGMGVPDTDQVRQRARELAEIDGRLEITDVDWHRAKQELHGGHHDGSESDDEMAQSASLGDLAVGSVGHHSENMRGDDDEHVLEELVAEGMDEAEHEQMLAARRARNVEDAE